MRREPNRLPSVLIAAVAALLTTVASRAQAGPPYATDDPVPTDQGHWEDYGFISASHVDGDTTGESGIDLNYGAAKDLQLTLVIPAAFQTGDENHVGMGTVEVAAKYRVLHQRPGSPVPEVAVFPRLFLPTAGRRFGSRRVGLLLPLWVGKDAGPWSVFGGGGWQINPGPGNRNFWVSGVAVTRAVGRRLTVGAELYHHTRDGDDAKAFTGANLGAAWRLSEHWSLLASGGPGLQNAREEGRYAFYLALKADY